MAKQSRYEAKTPDRSGRIEYTPGEDAVWRDLYARQKALLPGRAHPEWINALERLGLPEDRVPQPAEVSATLLRHTGWQVEPVPALIPFTRFFELLSSRRFPAASFIRTREDFDYLQEPDIFHEIYGHGPLLTEPRFADALQRFGQAALHLGPAFFEPLHRLFWFTVEFGLCRCEEGLRVLGAGIASSPRESVYALESDEPERVPFDPALVCATDYRIDVLQRRYFVLDDLESFYELADRLETDLPRWAASAAGAAGSAGSAQPRAVQC